tara:strand:- start:843 stop:1058 length:216 start_codon:yes stop_codon:yes gene_type:complete
MEKLITEVVKKNLHISTKKDFEETIEKTIKNMKRKNLKIKIPRNSIKFKDDSQYDYVSPKICHNVNVYTKN